MMDASSLPNIDEKFLKSLIKLPDSVQSSAENETLKGDILDEIDKVKGLLPNTEEGERKKIKLENLRKLLNSQGEAEVSESGPKN